MKEKLLKCKMSAHRALLAERLAGAPTPPGLEYEIDGCPRHRPTAYPPAIAQHNAAIARRSTVAVQNRIALEDSIVEQVKRAYSKQAAHYAFVLSEEHKVERAIARYKRASEVVAKKKLQAEAEEIAKQCKREAKEVEVEDVKGELAAVVRWATEAVGEKDAAWKEAEGEAWACERGRAQDKREAAAECRAMVRVAYASGLSAATHHNTNASGGRKQGVRVEAARRGGRAEDEAEDQGVSSGAAGAERGRVAGRVEVVRGGG